MPLLWYNSQNICDRGFMHIFLTLLTVLFIMAGCSKTTAFDPFKMDDDHERAIMNLRTATIVQQSEAKVIISVISRCWLP